MVNIYFVNVHLKINVFNVNAKHFKLFHYNFIFTNYGINGMCYHINNIKILNDTSQMLSLKYFMEVISFYYNCRKSSTKCISTLFHKTNYHRNLLNDLKVLFLYQSINNLAINETFLKCYFSPIYF